MFFAEKVVQRAPTNREIRYMGTMKKAAARLARVGVKLEMFAGKHLTTVMFVLGVGLLLAGLNDLSHAQGGGTTFHKADYNDTFVRVAIGNLFGLVEGSFGALVMVVAGLGAIVAAAMGAYRGALALVVVAVGAFVLRALVSLFFGDEFSHMRANGGSGS
jgi:hypothetical protein